MQWASGHGSVNQAEIPTVAATLCLALGTRRLHSPAVDHQSSSMYTFLGRMNSSSPCRPPSRPIPLSLLPPNGAPAIMGLMPLIEMNPVSSSPATRSARGNVAGMDVAGEAVFAVVRERHGLVLIAESNDGEDRTEDLFLGERAGVVDVSEHRWGDEEASAQVAVQAFAASEQLAVTRRASFRYRSHDP